jgi:hypothetical protein
MLYKRVYKINALTFEILDNFIPNKQHADAENIK